MPTTLQGKISETKQPPNPGKRPKEEMFWFDIRKESKALVKLALGTCVNSFFTFLIPVCTMLIVGHKGKVSLASIGLGITICNVSGTFLVIALTSVTETLCSQAYGAKDFRRFGILIQRSIIITFVSILPTCALWINMDKILMLFGQDKTISRLAGNFAICYIPGLMNFVLFNVLTRYLACQGITYPIVLGSLLALVVNGVFCYLFVYVCNFGIRGAAFALDLSYFSFCFFVLFVIYLNKLHHQTWHGWSRECFFKWKEYFYLAIPTSCMILVRWVAVQLGILVLGTIGRTEQAAVIVSLNISGLTYFLTFGVSIGTAVRVGTFLGAGNPEMAKVAMKASFMVSAVVTVSCGLISIPAKDVIGYIFTNDRAVADLVSSVVIITAVQEMIVGFQEILLGVLRGVGYQKYGALITTVGYWFISIPLFLTLTFKAHLGLLAFRLGLSVGVSLQVLALLILLIKSDWTKLSNLAKERSCIASEDDHVKSDSVTTKCCHEIERESSFLVKNGTTMKYMEYEKTCRDPAAASDQAESESSLSDDESEKMLKNEVNQTHSQLDILFKTSMLCLLFALVIASLFIKVFY